MKTLISSRGFGTGLSRRRLLQGAGVIGASLLLDRLCLIGEALAATDTAGSVTVFTSAGQRWELPERAVLPLFQAKYPKIQVNIRPTPHGEANPKIQITMKAKSDAFDVVFAEYGQWPAMHALGALTDLTPYLDKDPAWRDDYFSDVPASVSSLYRVPANEGGTCFGLTPTAMPR